MKKLFRIWFTLAQLLTIPANIVLSLLLRLRVSRPDNFSVPKGTLIIANHQSKIDPFLISYHVGLRNLPSLLPIRYPVTPDYMNRPILGMCIRLLGGYSIGDDALHRMKQLVFTRELLESGYSIVLFPEGKIVRDSEMVAEFKRGVNVLFSQPHPIIFVKLTGLNNSRKFHFWKNPQTTFEYSECLPKDMPTPLKIDRMVCFYGTE